MASIFGCRVSRYALIAYCFLTCAVCVMLLILTRIDRHSIQHRAEGLYVPDHSQAEIPGTRSWKSIPRPEIRPEMKFQTSPYNWDNRVGCDLATSLLVESPPPEKLISWQASKTMRIRASSTEMFKNCAYSSCKVSPSDKLLGNSAAMVFDDEKMMQQTPPQLKAKRMLIYYSMKTPRDISTGEKAKMFGPYWTSAFNWVWSYRLDSDLFEPFGYIKKVNTKITSATKLMAGKYRLVMSINPHINRRKAGTVETDKNLHRGRSDTGLEQYMNEFKTAAICDSYNMPDLTKAFNPVDATKVPFSITKYFFVLAFEWVDCVDYISDVVLFAYDPRIVAVPVVRGSFPYAQHLPTGTYVNADDFPNPVALVMHLKKLARDKRVYSEMLVKKMEYSRVSGLSHAWCRLCEMLHRVDDDEQQVERIDDIHAWFREGGPCVGGNKTAEELEAELNAEEGGEIVG